MSMPSPLSFPELDFSPAPDSPSFTSFLSDSPSGLWCDQSISLLDDCDSVSMLSHSSGDETSSPASFFESSGEFVDPMVFPPVPVYENKVSPTFMNQGFKFDMHRYEHNPVVPLQTCVEQVVEPVPQYQMFPPSDMHVQQAFLSQHLVEPSESKSRKRRSSSSNSSVASGDSHDSNKTRKPKRSKRSSNSNSETESHSSHSVTSEGAAPNVDVGLVSSLLAESELKKNRLARKAELARLGRKAKNDQIESLQQKVKDLKVRLQAAKDHNSNLAIGPTVKVEPRVQVTHVSISEALSVLDVSYGTHATLVARFINWLSNQNDKFYCDSNTRGLLASLTDKSLGMTDQQKKLFLHVLRSHATQPGFAVADCFDAVDKAIKQIKCHK